MDVTAYVMDRSASQAWFGICAYIDPGTQTQVVWMFSSLLAGAGVFMGILLWPLRRLLGWVRRRFSVRAALLTLGATAGVLAGAGIGVWALWFRPDDAQRKVEFPTVPTIQYDKFDRVIVLGMDGLSPTLLAEMMDRGELPNFSRLRAQGCFSPMQTTLPPETPVAWSAIATGVNPGKHGIFDFLHRDPKTYRPILAIYRVNTSLSAGRANAYLPVRQSPGFWTPVSQAGVPTLVFRWPAAFPPEPVNGAFLSGLGVPDVIGRLGQYNLFTTAGGGAPARFKGRWHHAAWDGDTFTSQLPGPVTAGLTGRREAAADVVVQRLDGRIKLTIGRAEPVELAVGQWSGYLPIEFRAGWGKGVSAIVRACLTQLNPELKLYVSTPEVDPADPHFPISYPDEYARELARSIGRYQTLGMPEDVNALNDGTLTPEAFETAMVALFEERRKQFRHELGRFKGGLFTFVFDEGDRVQHMFWAARDPRHPTYDAAFAKRFAHVIPDLYRRMDGVLGEALALTDDRTAVICCSDHGFTTFRTAVSLNSWLVENGYQTLTTPTGRSGRELYADVDWSRTRAYAVGFTGIYLNVKGRERDGAVADGPDRRALCEQIKAKLEQLVDPVTGERAVKEVYIAADVYRGPHAAEGPDLVVGFAEGFRAESSSVIGGSPAAVLSANTDAWSGDHLMDPRVVPGFFAANVKLREGARPRNMDVAPSVLQCFGLPRPDDCDGEPLFQQ